MAVLHWKQGLLCDKRFYGISVFKSIDNANLETLYSFLADNKNPNAAISKLKYSRRTM